MLRRDAVDQGEQLRRAGRYTPARIVRDLAGRERVVLTEARPVALTLIVRSCDPAEGPARQMVSSALVAPAPVGWNTWTRHGGGKFEVQFKDITIEKLPAAAEPAPAKTP